MTSLCMVAYASERIERVLPVIRQIPGAVFKDLLFACVYFIFILPLILIEEFLFKVLSACSYAFLQVQPTLTTARSPYV